MFSVAPNILLAPNMTQNAERKHRTQNTNTAHFQSSLQLKLAGGGDPASMFRCKKVIMHQLGQASITKQVSQESPWCNPYTF